MKTPFAGYLAALYLCLSCGAAFAAEPCCGITAIDARSGTITAFDAVNKRTLQFKAPALLVRSLKVGQKVHVDYRTRKVSVDGIAPCCNVVTVRPAEPLNEPTTAVQDPTNVHRAEPLNQPNAAVHATIDPRPAEPVGQPQATSQAMSSAAVRGSLAGKRALAPVKAGGATENPGRRECADKGGEWRCTTVSTGSDPGPGDDVLSCVCINR